MDIKSALLEAFVQYLLPVLCTGLAGLVSWAFLALRRKWEADGKVSRLEAVGIKLTTLASSVVHELEVTIRADLKAAAADGKLTKEEMATIKQHALDKLKQMLGQDGLKEAAEVLGLAGGGLVDHLLSGLVEKAVATVPSKPSLANGAGSPGHFRMPGGLP